LEDLETGNHLSRKFSLTAGLVLIITLSLSLSVNSADAVSQPQIPTFTVKLVAHPYDVPTTYSTDPYTGKNITHSGYHVENRSIEVTIQNQPFTPQTDEKGNQLSFYFGIKVKGHFTEEWTSPRSYGEDYSTVSRVEQASGQYTVISLSPSYPEGAQIDFQIQASIGYYYWYYGDHILPLYQVFQPVEQSSWSNTQTLTMGDIGSTAVPTATAWPSSTETPTTQGPEPSPTQSATSQPTPTQTVNPTPTSNPTTTATQTPTQNPTQTTTQPIIQTSTNFNLNWEHVTIAILCIALAIVTIALFISTKKLQTKKNKEKLTR
jgi:hypothetical protein